MGISLGKIGYIQSPAEATATQFFGGGSQVLVSPEFEANIKKIIKQSNQSGTGGGTGSNIQGGSTKDKVSETSDQVTGNVTYNIEGWDWKDIIGTFFPPVALLNQGSLPPGTTTPEFTITGPSDFFQQQGPIATNTSDDSLGLGDITNQFGSLIKIAIPLLLIGFAASTLKSFKGLFS
jgi:hypothetical protein